MVWTGSWTSGLCSWEPKKIDVSCFVFFLFLFFVVCPLTCHVPLFQTNTDADLGTPADIKDPLLRAFAKGECPFDTLRCYAEQTQDNELMSKVEIVNKYKCHIPDMVARLKECAESNRSRAGLL